MNLVYSLYFIILNWAKIFNTLSTSEIVSIETYLQQKWRLFNVPLLCRQKSEFQELLQTHPNLRKGICSKDIESESIPVKKSGCRQCDCPYEVRPMLLGPNFYPNRLHTKACLSSNCCKTSSGCKEIFYEVIVLRQKKHEEVEDNRIPISISQYWKSEKVNVTAACQCLE